MEWFGLSSYGVSNPFKDYLREDYKEPMKPESLLQVDAEGKLKRRFFESISELDVYIRRVDGFAYRSNDRLRRMRLKGVFKPIGPHTMYKYPCATSMDVGWWLYDENLKGEDWYKTKTNYCKPVSERTRFVNHALKFDKVFRL